MRIRSYCAAAATAVAVSIVLAYVTPRVFASEIGQEVAVPVHLADGDEYDIPLKALLRHGKRLFGANWTIQEGGGRPFTKGTGGGLADPSDPLVFPRNFNRISAPDANSCAGCHNAPFGIPGGGGDIVANVFVLGQRFDFLTFDPTDLIPTKGGVDELGSPVQLQNVANSRATLGMFGSGYIEMLARQITADLQETRDGIAPGDSAALSSKGLLFGSLSRSSDGSWETAGVEGLPASSLGTTGPSDPPSLVIRPFHQAGRVISIREFTNNAMNHHHGIQTAERFGTGVDPDGDGFVDELGRADVTAVSVYQATLAVPGRVIPNDPAVEAAIEQGEQLFESVGCSSCHVASLPLTQGGWVYSEPNPYNPVGNLRPGDAPTLHVNLASHALPGPRLRPKHGVVNVPAYTDFKLHDVTCGATDPNVEPLDMQAAPGSPEFFAGNAKFLTRKLWGVANEPPYFHHGQFTTMRQAVLAHCGEALSSRATFEGLTAGEQDSVIEFLKSLQVLPPGTRWRVVDERGRPKHWN
jgi:hypothetical protein